jgi:putative selenium metabolism protein SsnA
MILIGNGIVITRDKDNTIIKDGAVVLKEQLIHDIGSYAVMNERYPGAEYIDAHGGIIMPGFINGHTHIYSAFARGLSIKDNHPSDFLEILKGTWWRIDRKLTLEQVKYSAAITYLESIKNGVTTLFDHHASFGSIEDSLSVIAKVAKDMGVRTSLCYEISDRDGLMKMKQSVEENVSFGISLKEDTSDMIKNMMGMHASFTLSDETLDYCLSRKDENTGIHIHVAEGLYDAIHCKEKYKMSVINRLYKKGILGKKTIAGHCVHLEKEDYDLLKDTNTAVIHNPESNMGNAVGCPDVLGLMGKGILVGLGTDGYTSDMLESMKVANVLLKHNAKNPSAAWSEVPTMLFDNNRAIASRYYHKLLGILEKGAYADVIVLDYKPPTPMDKSNINGHLLFGTNGRDVITTVVNGKVRMKDRVMVDIDEDYIRRRSQEEAEHLWSSL